MFKRFSLVWVLLFAIAIRLWYLSATGWTVRIQPDSQGYYLEQGFYNKNILSNFFSIHRTPGYALLTGLFIKNNPIYLSPSFMDQAKIFIVIQSVLGIFSLLVLFDTLIALKLSKKIALLFTAFTSLNIYQFIWDRAFLTESLYISLFIILMRVFVALLHKPTVHTGIFFVLISWYEFLLKPAALLIPFLLLPLVWFQHKSTKLLVFLIFLYTLLPVSYLVMNQKLHTFKGIGYNTDFAVFGRILQFNIPVEAAKSVPNLYQKVIEYRAAGGNVRIPWYFFVYYGNEVYGRLAELQEFNRLVLKDQIPVFIWSVVTDIPKAFFHTDVEGVLESEHHVFFKTLDILFQMVQKSTIIFLVLWIPTIILFFKKRTALHTFLCAIVILEWYTLLSSLVFGGAWEFARHILPMQTFLFFFCFWWIQKVWKNYSPS